MDKQKYTYKKDLKLFGLIRFPVMPAVVPVAQTFLNALYYLNFSSSKMKTEKIKIPSDKGGLVDAIVFSPSSVSKNSPCLVFYHGGGFAYPGAPHHYSLPKKMAEVLNIKTVYVNYRLAPKHKFPTAPIDAFSAYKWVVENSDALKINKNKIAVMGDSAGGNLATVVCLMARDNKVQMPCAQVLLYPFVDRKGNSESMKKYFDAPMVTKKDCEVFNSLYVDSLEGEREEYFSPIDAESLKGLPEAYVEVAEFDCLKDSAISYAERLKDFGVETEIVVVEGAMHGYDIATKSKTVASCIKKRADFLKAQFDKAEKRKLVLTK